MDSKWFIRMVGILPLIGMFFLWPEWAFSQVPARISVKFILDTNNNRPAAGNINDDDEVRDQVTWGNTVLGSMGSEYRIELLEIVNVAGISQYYNSAIDATTRDNLRNNAISNSTLYRWRTDCVNIYINNDTGSGISDFPSNNNIVLLGQGSWDTTLPHELGHILNLIHTHENDTCDDTITDNSSWNSQDDIALNNYGTTYSNLSPAQQEAVDTVWFNLMSYHNTNTRNRLTTCQLNRWSRQGYDDRNWLLSKTPFYVGLRGAPCIFPFPLWQDGSFDCPYWTFQDALDSGQTSGKVVVFQSGDYGTTQSQFNDHMDLATRQGSSTIQRQNDAPNPSLPINIEESQSAEVRKAIKQVKEYDRIGDRQKALESLKEAEGLSKGMEKTIIQLELAQRYRYLENYEMAIKYYQLIEETTDKRDLKEKVRKHIQEAEKKIQLKKSLIK